jgi:hypothetical protein
MINPSAHGWIDKFFLEQKALPEKPLDDAETFTSAPAKLVLSTATLFLLRVGAHQSARLAA